MRVLQIDYETLEDIQKVVKYANEYKFDKHQMKLIMSGDLKAAGLNPDFVVYIHDGYRVVYSIEEHPIGRCQHISISVDRSNKYPQEFAVKMILEAFGMSGDFKKCLDIWLEKETESVNILQKVGEKSTSMERAKRPGIEIKSYGSPNEMMDDWVARGFYRGDKEYDI
jgi:hypothetical protein